MTAGVRLVPGFRHAGKVKGVKTAAQKVQAGADNSKGRQKLEFSASFFILSLRCFLFGATYVEGGLKTPAHYKKERKKTDNPREGWEDGMPPPHRDFDRRDFITGERWALNFFVQILLWLC